MAVVDVNIDAQVADISIKSDDNFFEKYRKSFATKSTQKMEECFNNYDKNRDGFLDREEFTTLINDLYCKNGKSYKLSQKHISETLKLLDENKDGKLDIKEFRVCWHHWLKQVLDPVACLVVVDVQNDFIDGTLAVKNCSAGQEGEAVVPIINSLLKNAHFDLVVYSLDWHPKNHISFVENVGKRKLHSTSKVKDWQSAKVMDTVVFEGPPSTEQKLWPAHCVQESWGAEMHKDLIIVDGAVHIKKGSNPNIDSYSAFWDNKKMSQTGLLAELTKRGVTDVYTCGLASDVCVGLTALQSIEHGFRTVFIEDASRGVDLEDIGNMRKKLIRQGAIVIDSSEVSGVVDATDRRPELGYQAALNVAMARKLVKDTANK